MDSHYTDISSQFDYLFGPIHEGNVPIIINKLQLRSDDLLVDIGAATGRLAHLIWKQTGLKNPITCVEPCEAFFEHASKLDGIVPVVASAEEFCDKLALQNKVTNQTSFNKVLLCGVVHHFDDIPKRIGQIIDYLPKNGVCFIMQPPSAGSSLPTIKCHQRVRSQMPEFLLDVVAPYVKSRDDVIVEVTTEETSFRIPKSRWYYMIRNHFYSTLRKCTEEEIEEGIQELDNERFQGIRDDEIITVPDNYTAIKITKI